MYQLARMSQKNLKNCSHFTAGLIKIQKEEKIEILPQEFVKELIAENEARENIKILANINKAQLFCGKIENTPL